VVQTIVLARSAIAVPVEALRRDASGSYFVKCHEGDEKEYRNCVVEIGVVSDLEVVVVSGLDIGTTVRVTP
jgi:hypothetical protein